MGRDRWLPIDIQAHKTNLQLCQPAQLKNLASLFIPALASPLAVLLLQASRLDLASLSSLSLSLGAL